MVTGICGKEGDLRDFSATVRKFGRICTLEGRKGFRGIGFLHMGFLDYFLGDLAH